MLKAELKETTMDAKSSRLFKELNTYIIII